MENMNLDYCKEDFTREEVYALFEAFIKKHPEHYIKRIDGYPYYLGREIGAWCADVHNKALAGVLILGKNKEIYLQWQYTTSGEILAP